MGAAVSRRQTWGRDAPSDAAKIQVMVRCQDNRVIGAWVHAGQVHLTRISPPAISTRLLNYVTSAPGLLGAFPCPNHEEGHKIDGDRLREAIYRRSPQGRTKKRGKVPSVDIKTVELA
jgi:hypothetical protein